MQNPVKDYIKKAAAAVSDLEKLSGKIDKAVDLIVESYNKGGKVILFGNGGSAADAQHIATEFVARFRRDRPAVPAISLTTNTSMLTAIGNDYGFEEIFSRQLEASMGECDVVVAISTSGASKNVLKAIETARAAGLPVIGFTAGEAGEMKNKCDLLINVPADETSHAQECHIVSGHAICEMVEKNLFEKQ